MSEVILEMNSVTKLYRKTKALSDVSIELESGRIYGLIGRNGAGKTTMMRLICGLAFADKGSIRLFGDDMAIKQRDRVGCLIESPGLVAGLSARENLAFHKRLRGVPDEGLEEELLKTVGLEDAGRKSVRHFSLGMKQRLGIAIALVGSPELLILDEPINGLDPIGVVEIRELLLELCEKRHITLLISSHNLPELYQLATDYIIIDRGEIRKRASHAELDESCRHHIAIRCSDKSRLASVIEEKLGTNNYRVMPDGTLKLYSLVNEEERVAKTLIDSGIVATRFAVEGDTLENYFLSVVGGE